MGCVQARPSTYSPPRGVEKMKMENGYIGGKVRGVSGRKNFSTELSKPPRRGGDNDNNTAKVVGGGAAGGSDPKEPKEGKKIIKEEEKESNGGNVSQGVLTKSEVTGDELVDGWPKWLTDNIPRLALVGLIPKSAESYDKIEKIGQGTYSNVYKARDRDSGKIVALKKVRFDTSEPESIRFMAREIMILQHLNHPNVLKLEGLATSRMQYSLYLVFEYMVTDLSRIIMRPDGRLTEPQVKCYMQQLLAGLQHCHGRGILHRDIKGSNLLINRDGVLKIGDFGLANYFDPEKKRPLTSRVVTLWYRAPELLLGSTDYGVGIDLWSAGCLMAEMFAGRPIMPGRTEVEQLHRIFKLCGSPSEDYWKKLKLPTSFRPPQPYKPTIMEAFRDYPDSSLGLLAALLSLDPTYRGTASSSLQNEFFTTSPLACEISGLPIVHKEEEPYYIAEKIKNKKTRRSRTQRERKREMSTKKSEGDSGSSKEEKTNTGPDTGGSSTGSTSSSVKPTVREDILSPPLFLAGVNSQRKESPRTDGHPNATKNIKNMPPFPSTKTTTTKYKDGKTNNMIKLSMERRSVSTRDFRLLDAEKNPKRYAAED